MKHALRKHHHVSCSCLGGGEGGGTGSGSCLGGGTRSSLGSGSCLGGGTGSGGKARHAAADSQGTIDSLRTYMYVCLALAAVNALSIAVYFPSVPALPPSRSAGVYAMTNQT